jgi:hypothetical protein
MTPSVQGATFAVDWRDNVNVRRELIPAVSDGGASTTHCVSALFRWARFYTTGHMKRGDSAESGSRI